mgnify:CR=1 FL=1
MVVLLLIACLFLAESVKAQLNGNSTIDSVRILNPEDGEIIICHDSINIKDIGDVAIDFAGNGVVVWHSNSADKDTFDIYGQLFDENGLKGDTSFLINSFTHRWQWNPKVAMDAVGNFVVIWES